MPQPWERQPEETNKSWPAFRLYRDMDPSERTIAKVSKQLGHGNPVTCEKWSRDNGWVSRAGSYDAHQDELNRARLERERTAASERRMQIAKNMQLVGGSKIQEIGKAIQEALAQGKPLPQISLKDAALLIDAGVKIERLEGGLTTGNTGISGPDGGPVRVVQYVLVDGAKPIKTIPATQQAAINKSPETISPDSQKGG